MQKNVSPVFPMKIFWAKITDQNFLQ